MVFASPVKKNVPARRLERFCRALRACEIVGRLPRRGAMLALGAGRGDVIIIYNISSGDRLYNISGYKFIQGMKICHKVFQSVRPRKSKSTDKKIRWAAVRFFPLFKPAHRSLKL